MKISISGIFNFLNLFKKKKSRTNVNEKWIDWARKTAVEEVTMNVKNSYNFVNIGQYLKDSSDLAMEELYLNTSLNITGSKKLTTEDLKSAFSLSLGEAAGIMAPAQLLEDLANHYFNNFYSDESQKEFYEIRHSR